ncbi:MAG: hypothetical protein HZB17_07670 [Chloroflexi bacterium]|nr:hypothetical protein [Chloroflexota bacterium]
MTTQQILHELKHLSTVDLLRVIEVATKQMLIEINTQPLSKNGPTLKEQLTAAAETLWQDYAHDNELRAFSTLDSSVEHSLRHITGLTHLKKC